MCVGTIEFTAGDPCVCKAVVDYTRNALTAVIAVEQKFGGLDGANALK